MTIATGQQATAADVNNALDAKIPKSILTEQGDVIYASAANTPAALAHGVVGDYLRSGGHGANPSWHSLYTLSLIVSDTLQNSNDTTKSTNSDTYTKIKEIKLNTALSVCRIKFDLAVTNELYFAYAKIYKNGVAIGTERATMDSTPTTYSEDFTGFAVNDLIQIYAKSNNFSGSSSVSNMRFYYEEQITAIEDVGLSTDVLTTFQASVTNQDP